MICTNPFYTLEIGGASLFSCRPSGKNTAVPFDWPIFEIDGEKTEIAPETFGLTDRRFLNDKIEQLTFSGEARGCTLKLELLICAFTPFFRFRYFLSSNSDLRLTKSGGDSVSYFSYPDEGAVRRTEVRLSEYDQLVHSYRLREVPAFEHEDALMGPILAEERRDFSLLVAYEHGSTYPDKYLCYEKKDGKIALCAVKGNYLHGQSLRDDPFESIWFQAGAVDGDTDALARAYREFQLEYCSLNAASRKPYIFYNTWAYQERNRFYNKQAYLSSMNEERITKEIGIAHKMGVDVFVIDTGWFSKTGDWETNGSRFPSGMKHIADLLKERGMILGLWFAPPAAACTSEILKKHKGNIRSANGKTSTPGPVWETEDSYDMCLVSDYWDDFADRLIELAGKTGVRYFKWDAVSMFGCDAPGHRHGGEDSSQWERADNYSFNLVRYLSKIADKVCAAVPDAIVDFDVTEHGRCVGLAFLSSGKYFAVNNGPYYPNYDITVPPDQWINVFVNPGPARGWVCRKTLCYDKWIPSVLFMTHYLPDDPEASQLINLASLVLGQNGIWGDLPNVSDNGVALFRAVLNEYKRVRGDVTAADPVVYGCPGDSFEVYEKINRKTRRGLISVFTNAGGKYVYRVKSAVDGKPVVFGGASISEKDGFTYLTVQAKGPSAAILFFGGKA